MERQMNPLDFEIRVTGPVPADVVDEIPSARLVARPVETILRGPVTDQGALHELLDRLQGLGLNLLEVRRLSASPATTGQREASGPDCTSCQRHGTTGTPRRHRQPP
jgi:hypothetical protein